MVKPTLVIMAAGMGSRYGGLKQIDAFGPDGELIIDYSVYDALQAGFSKVVFVIKKSIAKDFRERIGKRIEIQCDVDYVFQDVDMVPKGFTVPKGREKPWGTGHAILLCKNTVAGNFAVINADDFYGATSFEALCSHLNGAKDKGGLYDYSMIGYLLKNTITEHGYVARGICSIDDDGYLSEIYERTHIEMFEERAKYSEDKGKTWIDLSLDSTVSMNMWAFTPSIFEELEKHFEKFLEKSLPPTKAEFFLPEVVNALLKRELAQVKVIRTQARWAGVTYQKDKDSVKKYIAGLVEEGFYPRKLWGICVHPRGRVVKTTY